MEIGILGLAGGVVTTFATAATTWVFSRRQNKVEIGKLEQEIETMRAQREGEVKSVEVEIMERYRQLYNAMVDDLGKQLTDLKSENADIRRTLTEREKIVDEMARTMRNMENDHQELRKEMAAYKIDFPCAECPRRKTPKK